MQPIPRQTLGSCACLARCHSLILVCFLPGTLLCQRVLGLGLQNMYASQPKSTVGTVAYIAPEVLTSKRDSAKYKVHLSPHCALWLPAPERSMGLMSLLRCSPASMSMASPTCGTTLGAVVSTRGASLAVTVTPELLTGNRDSMIQEEHLDLCQSELTVAARRPELETCSIDSPLRESAVLSARHLCAALQTRQGRARRLEHAVGVRMSKPADFRCREASISTTVICLFYYLQGPAADLWSSAVILFVMLTGSYPFEDAKDPRNMKKTVEVWDSITHRHSIYIT